MITTADHLQAMVPAADGTALATEVFLPPGQGPWPGALLRTPYGIADQREEALRRAREGFAVAVQDVRGRFGSAGTFDLAASDRADGTSTVEWLAAQPFCDGRVAGWGVSYGGLTQWLSAIDGPSPLSCIAPIMAPAWWRGLGFRTGGAIELAAAAHWMPRQAATAPGLEPEAAAECFRRAFEVNQVIPDGTDRVLDGAALRHPALRRPRLADPWSVEADPTFARLWEALWSTPPPPPWALAPTPPTTPTVAAAALVLTGWYDPWCTEAIAAYSHLARGPRGDRHRLIISPSGHGFDPVRAWRLPPEAARYGLDTDHHWASEWLLDRRGPLRSLDAVTYWMVGDGWRSAPWWPPPDATPTSLHLVPGCGSAAGSLVADPPASTSTVGYVHDPERPVPSRGGSGMILAPGPVDQDGLTAGAHPGVVSFDGPTLVREVELAGPVTASVTFTSTAVDADVVVKLLDVAPDGTAVAVADGICRARWRHGGATPVWLVPAQPEPIAVWLGHVATRIAAGHRFRVDITSSAFPRWDVNPGTSVAEGTDGPDDRVVAHQVVFGGRTTPSSVTLHTLTGAPL